MEKSRKGLGANKDNGPNTPPNSPENAFEHILGELQVGIWEESSDESNNFWSDNTFSILGIEKSKTCSSITSILKDINPKHRHAASMLFQSIKNWEKPTANSISFLYKRPNDQNKFLCITLEAIINKNDEVQLYKGTIQDLTHLKTLTKELHNIKDILNSIPLLTYAIDSTWGITFWNKTCEGFTGYKSSEIIGNRENQKKVFINNEKRRKIRSKLKKIASSPISWQQQLMNKKGEVRDIAWRAIKFDEINPKWNVIVVGHDITNLKKNEQGQKARLNELEILNSSAIAMLKAQAEENPYQLLGKQLEKHFPKCLYVVCSLDPDEQFFTIQGVYGVTGSDWKQIRDALGWNPVGRRFHVFNNIFEKVGKGELLQVEKSIYELTDGVVSSAASRTIERIFSIQKIFTIALLHEIKILGGIIVLTTSDFSESNLSSIEKLVNQSSIGIERITRESKLFTEKERAEEQDKLKNTFLANLSHEIRTPMNAILGFSQLLNLPNLTKEKRKQYIEILNSKGKMLVKLINDIVDASMVESGQLTLIHAPFNLNNLLNHIKIIYEKEKVIQKRENIDIILSLPSKSNRLNLVTDEGRLEQIITNLMGNALKFTEKGAIEFGYTLKNDTLEFFVKDTGIGIDADKHQVIFDRFWQLKKHTTRAQAGTGLGLSISKGIVELLGGRIWVESASGEGAIFRFTIPYIKPKNKLQGKELTVAEFELSHPDWKNKVILIAEDEESNYIYISELIENTGVKILWARDGAQAVELVKTIKTIDAILMDIKMPVMDGYAATLEIRQINPNIPIIAQTAYAYTEDRQKAEAAGCDEYITKPIDSKELFDKLEGFLG